MRSHRKYPGESLAFDAIDWLNEPSRLKSDPVERLWAAYSALPLGRNDYWFAKTIRSILRGLTLVPFCEPVFQMKAKRVRQKADRIIRNMYPVLDRTRSAVEWLPKARGMRRGQSLALFRMTQLHALGQIGRVRRCENQSCGRWFYAHKHNQRFDSRKCSQEVWRAKPGRRLQRAKYMRDRRRTEKERAENQGLIIMRRKGKYVERGHHRTRHLGEGHEP